MNEVIEHFRASAALWFEDKLNGVEIRRLMNDLYGAMRSVDSYLDDYPDHSEALQALYDLQRVWNSLVVEKQRLQSEAQDRFGPDYCPHRVSAGEWTTPVMDGFIWGCCGCHHKMIVEFRVRDQLGNILRDGSYVEYRTFGVQ